MEKGERYGMLVCLGRDTIKDSRYYLFKCDCGNIKSIIQDSVKRGATKSCGCYSKTHPSHYHNGMSHTRIDNIYKSMIARCYNPKAVNYKRYGGRKIEVCKEWKENKNEFFKWSFHNGYTEKLTIDRIDPNGDYCPDNCRWATYKEQANNKRNTRFFEYKGERKTLSEWSEITHIKSGTIWNRINVLKWSVEKALTTIPK